jgi:NADH dehydrogenase FAD-containing subunit
MAVDGPLQTRVVIVGAGFGGIGLAVNLKKRGCDDFIILENPTLSVVSGTRIVIPAPRATCRRIFIRFRSNCGPTGRTNTRARPKY